MLPVSTIGKRGNGYKCDGTEEALKPGGNLLLVQRHSLNFDRRFFVSPIRSFDSLPLGPSSSFDAPRPSSPPYLTPISARPLCVCSCPRSRNGTHFYFAWLQCCMMYMVIEMQAKKGVPGALWKKHEPMMSRKLKEAAKTRPPRTTHCLW